VEKVGCACGVSCLRCVGVPVHISYWYFLWVIAVVANCFRFSNFFIMLCLQALAIPVLFVAVLFFAMFQTFICRLMQGHTTHIVLWPWIGAAHTDHNKGVCGEFVLAMLGSVALVPWVVATAAISIAEQPAGYSFSDFSPASDLTDYGEYFGYNYVTYLFWLLIILLVINTFVPAYPLNGAKIMAALLSPCCGMERTAKALVVCGLVVGLPALVVGIWQDYMLLAITGLNVLFNCYKLNSAVGRGQVHAHPLFVKYNRNRAQDDMHRRMTVLNDSSEV